MTSFELAKQKRKLFQALVYEATIIGWIEKPFALAWLDGQVTNGEMKEELIRQELLRKWNAIK